MKTGKVRLHPLPAGAPQPLSEFLSAVVGGATRSALMAHTNGLSKQQLGSLVGSIRKRIVNQLVCAEGVAKLKELVHD